MRVNSVLRRRLVGFGIVAILMAAFIYISVTLARIALECACTAAWVRISLLSLAAVLMVPPIYLAVSLVARKWKTGRFLLSREEAAGKRAEVFGKMGAGKPFWPQAHLWILPLFFAAMFLALGILATVGAVVVGRSSAPFSIGFSAVAALFFFIPGRMVFKAIQRKLSSGSFLPSVEEIEKVRANRGKPGKRWIWVLAAVLGWLNVVVWTVKPLIQHSLHRPPFGLTWMPTVMWWFTALIWTWQAFRKTPPQCERPNEPEAPQAPSGEAGSLLAQ